MKSSQKESSFSGRDTPDKISRGSQSAVACNTLKICGFVPQEHKD